MPKTNTPQRIEASVQPIESVPIPESGVPPAMLRYIGVTVVEATAAPALNLLVEAHRAAKRILPELVDLRPFTTSNSLAEVVTEKPRSWSSGVWN